MTRTCLSVLCIALVASPVGLLAQSSTGTALPVPNYFNDKPIDTSFVAGKFVINGATHDDIRQAGAPTCSLMAAISAAAHSGMDLSRNIQHLGGKDYSVKLFVRNSWTDVKVSFNGWTKYDPAPNDAGEFWVALYQRAYLTAFDVDCSDADDGKWVTVKDGKKTDREKDSQPWRQMSVALATVTGRPVEVWTLDSDNPVATVNRIREALEQKRCVVVGTIHAGAGKKLVEDRVFLVANHAYSVTAAGPDWIDMRNPWGHDVPLSLLAYQGSKNGKDIYAYKDGGDGKNDDPNDSIVRAAHPLVRFLDYAVVTK